MNFGAELRRRRLAIGLSLGELAESVHYSRGYLSKVENGLKSPSPALAQRCDARLDAGGALAAAVPGRPRPAKQPVPAHRAGSETWVLRLEHDGTSRFTVFPDESASPHHSTSGLVSVNLVNQAGMGAGTSPPAAPARPGDPAALDAFRGMFDLLRKLSQSVGPSVVLPALTVQTHAVQTLARTSSGVLAHRMTTLAAHFAQHTGWMAQEAGDDAAALWWTEQAAAMASSVGKTDLCAYAMVRRALLALYRDDAAQTIGLARRAQAGSVSSARIRGLGALREAQGHALAGDRHACERAIDRATELIASGLPSDAGSEAGEPVVGPSNVPDLVMMIRGWCLAELGRAREAVEILEREVARIPATAYRTRARFGARLALAHAANGDVEQACTRTADVVAAVRLVDSATIRVELRNLRRTLTRWHSHHPVRELLPGLVAALHMPAAG